MKPIKLTIKGLNSFASEQSVDFEMLTKRGLFGIFGPTGSGKTTILDAITLSLYGDISRKSTNFININSSVMNISFEFEITSNKSNRYKVIREFKRNNAGGINTNLAKLIHISDNIESVIEEGKIPVDKKCYELIGLSLGDFTRTVVLPQGKFSDFLKLKGTERRDMLERLLGLERFGDNLTLKLNSHIKELKTISSESDGQLRVYDDIDKNQYLSKKTDLLNLTKELKNHNILLDEKQNRFNFASRIIESINSLNQLEAEMSVLLLMQESINEKIIKLEKAKISFQLMSHLENFKENKNSIEKLEEEKKLKKEILTNLESELDKAIREFKEAENKKETELNNYISLKENVIEAIKQNEIRKDIQKKNENLKIEIESDKNILDSLIKKQEDCLKFLNISSNRAESMEVKLTELTVDAKTRQSLKNLIVLQEKYNLHKSNSDILEKRLETQKLKHEHIQNQANIIEGKSNEINETLKKQKELYKKNSEDTPADENDILEMSKELYEAKYKLEIIKELESKNINLNEKITELEAIKQNSQSKMDIIKPKMDSLKNEERDISVESSARELRTHLERLGYCPVCKNTHFSFISEDKSELKQSFEIVQSVNDLQSEYDKLILDIKQYEFEIKSNKEILKENIKELENTKQTLKIKNYNNAEDDFENLKKVLQEYKINQDKLKKNIEELEHNKNQFELKLSAISSDYVNIKSSINETELQRVSVVDNLNSLKKDTDILKKHLDIDNIDVFNQKITDIDSSYENLKILLKKEKDKYQKLNTENENLKLEISQKSSSALVKNMEFKTNEKEIGKLMSFVISKAGKNGLLDEYLKEINCQILLISERYKNANEKREFLKSSFAKEDKEMALIDSSIKDLYNRVSLEKDFLDKKIIEHGFNNFYEISLYYLCGEEMTKIEEEIKKHQEKLSEINIKQQTIKDFVKDEKITSDQFLKLEDELKYHKTTLRTIEQNASKLKEQVENIMKRLDEKAELLEKKKKIDSRMALLSDMESLFRGKKFVEFAAINQLNYICMEASKRLMEISSGSYGIEVDDAGSFVIRDYKNGGALRDASTLSGGETFLASLSLALALSSHIQLKGKSTLEFFFLDEGFGTLDENTIDTVMNSLEKIYNEKLSIGIISHVESIKSRVPVKLIITPAGINTNSSSVKIEVS